MASLFKSPKAPPPPPPPEPTPMVDEAAVKKAKRAAVQRLRLSSGRESTILGSADKLGA